MLQKNKFRENGFQNGSPKFVTNSKVVAFRVDECITRFSNATEIQQSNGTKTIRSQATFQVTYHKSPSWGVSLPAPTDTGHVEFVCIRPFLLMNENKVDSSRNPLFVHELRQNNMSYPKPAGSGKLCSSWHLAQVEAKHLAAAACGGVGWLTACVFISRIEAVVFRPLVFLSVSVPRTTAGKMCFLQNLTSSPHFQAYAKLFQFGQHQIDHRSSRLNSNARSEVPTSSLSKSMQMGQHGIVAIHSDSRQLSACFCNNRRFSAAGLHDLLHEFRAVADRPATFLHDRPHVRQVHQLRTTNPHVLRGCPFPACIIGFAQERSHPRNSECKALLAAICGCVAVALLVNVLGVHHNSHLHSIDCNICCTTKHVKPTNRSYEASEQLPNIKGFFCS